MQNLDPTRELIPEELSQEYPEISIPLRPGLTLEDIEGEDDPEHPESIEGRAEFINRRLDVTPVETDRQLKYRALTSNKKDFIQEQESLQQSIKKSPASQGPSRSPAIPNPQQKPLGEIPTPSPNPTIATDAANTTVQTREAGDPELPEMPEAPGIPTAIPEAAVPPAPAAPKTGLEALMEQYRESKARDADALKKAKEKKSTLDLMSALAKAGQGIGLAGTGVAPTKFDLAKDVRKEITQIKGKDQLGEAMKLSQIQKTLAQIDKVSGKDQSSDPNSAASIRARKMHRISFPGVEISDNISAKELKEQRKDMIANRRIEDYYIKKNIISEKRLDENVKEKARKWFNDNQEDLKKQIISFNKDPVIKQSKERIASVNAARDALERKNPILDEAMKTFLARASGEKGALSEGDIKRLGGSKALVDRVGQIKEELSTGILSDTNRGWMRDLVDSYEKTAVQNMKNIAKKRSNQFGGIDFPREILTNRFMGIKTDYFDPEGIIPDFKFQQKKAPEQPKQLVKKQYSPSANKTRLTYSDGSTEILNGRQ